MRGKLCKNGMYPYLIPKGGDTKKNSIIHRVVYTILYQVGKAKNEERGVIYMAQYDPKVIHKFADHLYSKANAVIVIYTIVGALIGGIGGYVLKGSSVALLGLVILGALGLYIGIGKAFSLKLQAQTALCQLKIEENTRKP